MSRCIPLAREHNKLERNFAHAPVYPAGAGTRAVSCRIVPRTGLSPLARGTLQRIAANRTAQRFIPLARGTQSFSPLVYDLAVYLAGAGTHDVSAIAPGYVRFIPAGAGTRLRCAAHPPATRFIPLARGILSDMLDDLSANRFIPLAREYEEEGMPELVDAGLSAGAGNTSYNSEYPGLLLVYPLARGVRTKQTQKNSGGLSRWRGNTQITNTRSSHSRFIPLARGILQIYPANSRSVRFIRWRGNTGVEPEIIGKKSVYPLAREYGPLRNPNGLVAGLSAGAGNTPTPRRGT
ncbi:hypothetical protein JT306_23425 [Salmonella enterica subsp. enterica serovar Kentucky]|nr:hypothetical protein [Salmonella enterica subsp. enterica serovar Kentucky]